MIQLYGKLFIFASSKQNEGHEAAAPSKERLLILCPCKKNIAATASGSGNTPEASRNLVWP